MSSIDDNTIGKSTENTIMFDCNFSKLTNAANKFISIVIKFSMLLSVNKTYLKQEIEAISLNKK